jgi:hypothetical protein
MSERTVMLEMSILTDLYVFSTPKHEKVGFEMPSVCMFASLARETVGFVFSCSEFRSLFDVERSPVKLNIMALKLERFHMDPEIKRAILS